MPTTVSVDPLGLLKANPGYPTQWSSRKIRRFVKLAQQAFDGTKKTESVGVFLQMGLTELNARAVRGSIRAIILLCTAAIVGAAFIAVLWDKHARKMLRDSAATNQETLDEMRLMNFTLVKQMRLNAADATAR